MIILSIKIQLSAIHCTYAERIYAERRHAVCINAERLYAENL